jgi:hypothetical protein
MQNFLEPRLKKSYIHVLKRMSQVIQVFSSLLMEENSKTLKKYRAHSRAFDVSFAENNVFATKPGPTRAVSDGYWVILEPLSAGKHDIHFKASLTNPTTDILFYNDDLKYTINVK